MFSLFRKKVASRGLIGHLGLAEWWTTDLEEPERRRILERYQPLGGSSESLIEGEVLSTSQSALHLLWGLATWFKTPNDYVIATKIFNKGEELVPSAEALDVHFFYQAQIEVFYRNRDEVPAAMNLAIQACEKQIALSRAAAAAFTKQQGPELPSHKGFQQLAIILEKEARFDEASRICLRAQTEGWSGEWESRLARLFKRAEQAKK
jgi:hypothetical protein